MSTSSISTALITGGTSGIGLATAQAIVATGGRVVITGRDPAVLDQALSSLGAAAAGVAADVTDLAALDRTVALARRHLGDRIALLFANAGIAELRPLADVDEAHYDRMMDVNAKGQFFTVQKSLPLLGAGSAVVLNSSFFDVKGVAGTAALAASKAAVRSMARVFAAELAPKGIRVNAVSPGAIATPIYGKLGLPPEVLAKVAASFEAQIPLGRFGNAEDIAQAVLFLATNPYITGIELSVDGGIAQV